MARRRIAALSIVLLLAAGCGAAADDSDVAGEPAPDPAGEPADDPAAGSCLAGDPDCVDESIAGPGADDGEATVTPDLAVAATLIGLTEDELPGDVRIGRRGSEFLALTEDYVVGRKTAELDEAEDGEYRVVSVTVEGPDGPVVVDGSGLPGEHVDEAALVDSARTKLGLTEADLELGPMLRIGRIGDDEPMLTMDHVVGRMTVELDEAPDGELRVTTVVVELTDGSVEVTEES